MARNASFSVRFTDGAKTQSFGAESFILLCYSLRLVLYSHSKKWREGAIGHPSPHVPRPLLSDVKNLLKHLNIMFVFRGQTSQKAKHFIYDETVLGG